MLLAIDIGNTNLTIGLYEGEELAWHWRLATDHERMPDEYGLQLLGLLTQMGYHAVDRTSFGVHRFLWILRYLPCHVA